MDKAIKKYFNVWTDSTNWITRKMKTNIGSYVKRFKNPRPKMDMDLKVLHTIIPLKNSGFDGLYFIQLSCL